MYYERLSAKIKSKNWKTKNFKLNIGLFQGCVLSTILFDVVFNLLLDFIKSSGISGYKFKNVRVNLLQKHMLTI